MEAPWNYNVVAMEASCRHHGDNTESSWRLLWNHHGGAIETPRGSCASSTMGTPRKGSTMASPRRHHGGTAEVPWTQHMGTPREHRGSTMETPRGYHGITMGTSRRKHHGSILESTWKLYIEPPCGHHGRTAGARWEHRGNAMGIPWSQHEGIMRAPRKHHCASVVLPWCVHGASAFIHPWSFHDDSMVLSL